jgi:hypothetical protein
MEAFYMVKTMFNKRKWRFNHQKWWVSLQLGIFWVAKLNVSFQQPWEFPATIYDSWIWMARWIPRGIVNQQDLGNPSFFLFPENGGDTQMAISMGKS